MANIARGEAKCYISIEAVYFCIAQARQCFNCYRELPLQICMSPWNFPLLPIFQHNILLSGFPSFSYCLVPCPPV